MNHFEARDYDQRLGRWLCPDPAGQYHSPYLGMGNNPVKFGDKDGRDIVVLLASQGARIFPGTPAPGHIALLIGNDEIGWDYYSKNGAVHGHIFNDEPDIAYSVLKGQSFRK